MMKTVPSYLKGAKHFAHDTFYYYESTEVLTDGKTYRRVNNTDHFLAADGTGAPRYIDGSAVGAIPQICGDARSIAINDYPPPMIVAAGEDICAIGEKIHRFRILHSTKKLVEYGEPANVRGYISRAMGWCLGEKYLVNLNTWQKINTPCTFTEWITDSGVFVGEDAGIHYIVVNGNIYYHENCVRAVDTFTAVDAVYYRISYVGKTDMYQYIFTGDGKINRKTRYGAPFHVRPESLDPKLQYFGNTPYTADTKVYKIPSSSSIVDITEPATPKMPPATPKMPPAAPGMPPAAPKMPPADVYSAKMSDVPSDGTYSMFDGFGKTSFRYGYALTYEVDFRIFQSDFYSNDDYERAINYAVIHPESCVLLTTRPFICAESEIAIVVQVHEPTGKKCITLSLMDVPVQFSMGGNTLKGVLTNDRSDDFYVMEFKEIYRDTLTKVVNGTIPYTSFEDEGIGNGKIILKTMTCRFELDRIGIPYRAYKDHI